MPKVNQFGFRSNQSTTDANVSRLQDIRVNEQNEASEIKVSFLVLKKKISYSRLSHSPRSIFRQWNEG